MLRKLVLVLLALMVAAGGCQRKPNLEASRNELRSADAEWSNAANDVDAFMNFVALNGSIMPPNEATVTGSENVRAWVTAVMDAPGFSLRWHATTADVAESGELGYTTGTYEMSMQGPDGMPIKDEGKYVTVWRKDKDGRWKVVSDIFNSALPLATAAPGDDPDMDDMMHDTMNDK